MGNLTEGCSKVQKFQSSKVKTFEELYVFEQARSLNNEIYRITRQDPFAKDYILANQIRSSTISVMSNIAEGFERGGNPEFIQFLYIAKGSCGEARTQLLIAQDQNYIDLETYTKLNKLCRNISSMLANFITYLKNSNFKGLKFKTNN
jgi:four helix bundle protein